MKFPFRIFSLVLLLMVLVLGLGLPTVAADTTATEVEAQFATPIFVVNASFLNIRTGPGVQYSVLITVVGGTELPVLGRANDDVWFLVSTAVGSGWVNSQFAIPRGDFSTVPVVNPAALQSAPVPANTPGVVGLPLDQGGGVQPSAATGATQTGAGGVFVAGLDANGNQILVSPGERFRATLNVTAVNLREQPDESSVSIVTLFRDETVDYPIVGSARDSNGIQWLAVAVPEYGTGWIDAPKLFLRLSAAFRSVMVVNRTVQLGDGPGSGSSTLPILTEGDEGFLVNISRDSNFVQIELGGGEVGWIPFDAARTRTGTPTDGLELDPATIAPVAPAEPGVTDPGVPGDPGISAPAPSTPRVVINTAFLNVRSGPGAQFTSISTLPGGMEVPVLARTPDGVWFLIQTSTGQGWINAEFAIFRGVYDNVAIVTYENAVGILAEPVAVISGPITIYAAPGTNFGAVGTISGPMEVPVVARTSDFEWVQLSTTLGFGWVPASQVVLRGDTSLIPVVG